MTCVHTCQTSAIFVSLVDVGVTFKARMKVDGGWMWSRCRLIIALLSCGPSLKECHPSVPALCFSDGTPSREEATATKSVSISTCAMSKLCPCKERVARFDSLSWNRSMPVWTPKNSTKGMRSCHDLLQVNYPHIASARLSPEQFHQIGDKHSIKCFAVFDGQQYALGAGPSNMCLKYGKVVGQMFVLLPHFS